MPAETMPTGARIPKKQQPRNGKPPTIFVTISKKMIVIVITGPNTIVIPMAGTFRSSRINARLKEATGIGMNVKQCRQLLSGQTFPKLIFDQFS